MSSGFTAKDKKLISFEINHGRVMGEFTLAHLDGNELNPDKIMMQLRTQYAGGPDATSNSMSVIITKDYTQVLSHMFRHMADVMDEWYEKEK
jgi:hypothetical protein